ncbi:MAG: rRNA maturation RNase YbeY [Bacteroidales bacterium]|jgi:rRNA maturation RNase YbeY|nr:rRNA maturation RNase YbeY [Bacteroidales bacterium]
MAVVFSSNTDFKLPFKQSLIKNLIKTIAAHYGKTIGSIAYVFCDDEYLLDVNRKFLNHDFYTDIITFDYTENQTINGDIIISVERVKDNAQKFQVPFEEELKRVIIHGILHLCGLKDKSVKQSVAMRKAEEEALQLFHDL